MASFTPYTYIQCPCFETSRHQDRRSDDALSPTSELSPDDDEKAFDNRAPRSNYSLYLLEYLLYCDVCHQIRCSRCVTEELVTIYCPSCLFEVGSSSVKTEGNRCTRSCFQCPICIGPLAVQSHESASDPSLLSADNVSAAAGPAGPWVLCCSYCNWSSSEIGVKFDKPQGIYAQMQKLRNGNEDHARHIISGDSDTSSTKKDADVELNTTKARFAAMKSFYSSQLASTNPGSGLASTVGDYGYGSPGALSRIMSLYSGSALSSLKPKSKPTMIREADSPTEGLSLTNLDEASSISALRRLGYGGTATRIQSTLQVEERARFENDLWPIPCLLRTKRARRCPGCRHILSKPEAKVSNTRWRIRLVAGNSIPSISVKPLIPVGTPGGPMSHLLQPLKPVQFLLTFKNPIFEKINVKLAAPALTPGRFESRVTLLCPQFHIDANSDDYNLDDVLKEGGDRKRRSTVDGVQQVEAGKEWERGRNWVSIVVEVIPASLRLEPKPTLLLKEGEVEDLSPLREDEDVLEIPLYVHLEWEGEPSPDQVGTAAGKDKDAKEKRELAYWCAIGIGRISTV